MNIHYLKVPKCENCELAFFTLSDTIWIGDIATEPKNGFFIILVLISMDFEILQQAECLVKKFRLCQN